MILPFLFLLLPHVTRAGRFEQGSLESLAVEELTEIVNRGLEREKKGERKFPRRFSKPGKHSRDRQKEDKDALTLPRLQSYFNKGYALPNGRAKELWDELMSWKDITTTITPEEVQQREASDIKKKNDLIVIRLKAIQRRGIAREEKGSNRFPMRQSSKNQEDADAQYI